MPTFVIYPNPAIDAARYHTQVEVDQTLFLWGRSVDVSLRGRMLFLIKFVPWADFARLRDGTSFLF